MENKEIRIWNTRYLADTLGETPTTLLAEKLDKGSSSQISQLLGLTPTKGIGHTMARSIEKEFDLPKGWLDQIHFELWKQIKYPAWKVAFSKIYNYKKTGSSNHAVAEQDIGPHQIPKRRKDDKITPLSTNEKKRWTDTLSELNNIQRTTLWDGICAMAEANKKKHNE